MRLGLFGRYGFPVLSPFWFIFVLLLVGLALIALHAHFERSTGKKVPRLFQAVILWLAAYGTFRYLLSPPIPFFLLAIYMSIVSVGIVMLLLSAAPSYEECRQMVVKTILAETPGYRVAQIATFTLIPLLAFLGTRYLITPPPIQEPIELRIVYPAAPAQINVHGKMYYLPTAKNPFREEEPSI